MSVDLAQLERALAYQPHDPTLWHIAAKAMIAAKDWGRAFDVLDHVQQAQPWNPEPVYQMGVIMDRQGDYPRADYWLRQARQRQRGRTETGTTVIWEALGNVKARLGNLPAAQRCYDMALAARDNDAPARFAKSQILLAREQWAEGWAMYESRWDIPEMLKVQAGHRTDMAALPRRWNGRSMGRVLVYAEQGTGDVLHMSRYLVQVEMVSGLIPTVVCQPELVPLFHRMGYKSAVPNGTSPRIECDWSVPFMSLPDLCGATLPKRLPHPFALHVREGKLRVGVCWKGSPDHGNDKDRSSPDSLLPVIAAIPNVEAVSLQHGEPTTFRDFLETAELVQSLDAVVTIDSAVVHLAGTLGVPTYLIPPTMPDWRWPLSHGERTPWYVSVRVIRRKTSRDWSPAVQQVVQHITRLAEET